MAERKSIYDLTPEQRNKGLALSFEKNDLVTRSPFDPAIWFVSSSTTEGHWYTVNTTHTTCECKAAQHHGYCRHQLRVWWEIQQEKKRAAYFARPDAPVGAEWHGMMCHCRMCEEGRLAARRDFSSAA